VYVEYISSKNGYCGSFYINSPYFKTFYFILKWVKARKLPHFIFIMLCFKMVLATPGNGHRQIPHAATQNSANYCQYFRSAQLYFIYQYSYIRTSPGELSNLAGVLTVGGLEW
jgi:hypothetical protein